MAGYKILTYSYSTTVLIAMEKILIPDLALVTVVIETGIKGWKAYQAVIPFNDEIQLNDNRLQGIAAHGKKLQSHIAFAMFPKLDPEKYNI